MTLIVEEISGASLAAALPEIAALRIEVFRDWPYLYDGDAAYEEQYLQVYLESARACVVGAFDGGRLVGAATATPLSDHAADFAAPFGKVGLPIGDYFYCAESVLLPAYRGQGAGHRFFDLREQKARDLGYTKICFAAVTRPEDHPMRPENARSLEPFWRSRGYAPLPAVVAHFAWKDVGDQEETVKPLRFWHRLL